MVLISLLATASLAADELPNDTAEALALYQRQPPEERKTIAPKERVDAVISKLPIALVIEYVEAGEEAVYAGHISPTSIQMLSSSHYIVKEEVWGRVLGERIELMTWESQQAWNPGPGSWLVLGTPYRLAVIGGLDYARIEAPEIYSSTAMQVPSSRVAFTLEDGVFRDASGHSVCLDTSGGGPLFNDCPEGSELSSEDAIEILRSLEEEAVIIPGIP